MKRIIATLSFVAASVILLAGCASVSGSSGTQPVDLTKPSVIASLCGADAASVQATVASAAKAKPSSGQRHTLVDWGITDPTNDKAIASILSSLKERAAVKDCKADSNVKTAVDTKMTDAERAAIIKALTIKTVPATAMCKTDEYGNVAYQIDSLLGVPPRMWSDAISTKITATDPTAARVELQEAICKDPNLGVTWLTFMATTVRDKLLAVTGIDLLALNPQLKAYTDASQITPKATAFVPLLNIEKPTTAQVDNAVKQNAAWQQDAALVNTLLERFAALGIDTRQSVVNYHLTDYALAVNSLPTVGINDKQENLPAQIFALTAKGQCGEITTFGANTGDKRPELFEAKNCAPPTTTTTPGCTTNCGSSTPGCTSNCGGTPGCTSNCTTVHVCPPSMPHGTWPVCKDSPSQAPNGSDGNGLSHDPTPTTPSPTPTQPPSTPRTNPAPPAPSPAPALKPDPAPAPAPEPSAPTQSEPATGCSPAPGMTTC